ncbi:MAG: hypothetical protein R3E39_09100 [Anaerolineae bacterium]
MSDQEFLKHFEDGSLSSFPHRQHIRMAWLYLRTHGLEGGTERIRSGIQHFAAVKGASTKYHETITVFWARVVYHAIQTLPPTDDYEVFISQHPQLLDQHLIERHYSRAVLGSERARREWVEPDLIALSQV